MNENISKCFRCKNILQKENVLDYAYYCINCEENMFNFEVLEDWVTNVIKNIKRSLIMIELNIFSGIMYASLLGVAIFGIYCNKSDFKEIKEILRDWIIGLNLKIWALIFTVIIL